MAQVIDADTHVSESASMWEMIEPAEYGRRPVIVQAPGDTLYGSRDATLIETISKGRSNSMPAFGEFLGEDKVHLLTAYVYGLSLGNRAEAGK